MSNSSIKVKCLKAGNGDCLIIGFQDHSGINRNILIDGGNNRTDFFQNLNQYSLELIAQKERFDLIIVTHIDQDHIKGILYLIEERHRNTDGLGELRIDSYWFNSSSESTNLSAIYDVSSKDRKLLESILKKQTDSNWIKCLKSGDKVMLWGALITILSPNPLTLSRYKKKYFDGDVASGLGDYSFSIETLAKREQELFEAKKENSDDSLENASSLAFLFEFEEKTILMLGDAIPETVNDSLHSLMEERNITKLKIDLIKLSHHASRKSLSYAMLKKLDCSKFLISTNGGKARLPNKATLAKILTVNERNIEIPVDFYFNFNEVIQSLNFTEDELSKYNFKCIGSNFKYGSKIDI